MQGIKQLYRFLNPRFQSLFLEYKVRLLPRYGHGKPPHAGLYNLINIHRATYAELLKKVLVYRDVFFSIKDSEEEMDPLQPAWNNGYLPGLDIIALFTMLAEFKPGQYVEVGSGNSTKVAFKAKGDLGLPMNILSIDPRPRAEIDTLADAIVRQPFEEVDLSAILALGENDVLFIDNSHRILPNSDAMVFFLEVLPNLKKGVLVHIHDVYLPYDYPPFMCERFYSEQYGLAMNLLANPARYEVLLPNYFISEDSELSKILAPIWENPKLRDVERHGGSFWLRIGE